MAARLDPVNVLINAAGILTENKPVDDLPADDFRRNYEVNVIGTLNACQAFAPLLKAGAGSVVNVASQAALVSLPSQAAYTASKGAVAALTRSLAIDWAEHGVRVNAVAPGFTLTPMTAALFENETFRRAATSRIPLGRLLEADEIAGAIVFLASPQRDRRVLTLMRSVGGHEHVVVLASRRAQRHHPSTVGQAVGDARKVLVPFPHVCHCARGGSRGPVAEPLDACALAGGLRRGHRVDGGRAADARGMRPMTYFRAVTSGDGDVELRIPPHAMLGHVQAGRLDLRLRADPHRELEDEQDEERRAERERAHGRQPECLHAQLVETASVEETALAGRELVGELWHGEEPERERSPDA